MIGFKLQEVPTLINFYRSLIVHFRSENLTGKHDFTTFETFYNYNFLNIYENKMSNVIYPASADMKFA